MTLHTHPEWQALLAGICAYPYDDLRRLVAADWLTENGEEEYAEFVRVQVDGGDATEPTPDLGDWLDLLPPNTAYTTREDALTLTAPAVLVRRGFVSEVRAPLSWLIGGECAACRDWPGRLRPRGSTLPARCPRCETTTGRAPAHLDELVKVHPTTRVVVADREPLFVARTVGGPTDDWCWVSHSPWLMHRDDAAHLLPAPLWDLLRDHEETISARVWARRYPTREAALDALSAALLTPARERACLPSLHPAAIWPPRLPCDRCGRRMIPEGLCLSCMEGIQ
jgi:uncharacterized protein (TIGR02996 family)